METIYDVFRALVNAARPILGEAELAAAHAIINKADPAVDTPEEAKPDA